MSYRYAIIGAGRQGTAAAYDLLIHGDAESLLIIDSDQGVAEQSARRLEGLTGRRGIQTATCDVTEVDGIERLVELLQTTDAAVSGVPYRHNLAVTQAAIRAGVSLCDFGGNAGVVEAQLALHDQAAEAGVSLVPDCGLEPGMFSSLLAYGLERFPEADEVHGWCGGLPVEPQPPWNYSLFFHIDGLINEYCGTATFLVEGQPTEVPTFSGYELVEIPELGTLEAFVTSGGTSTCPQTYQGRLRTLEARTLRYPGHYEQMRLLQAAGFFNEEPIMVANTPVVPRQLTGRLLDTALRARPREQDHIVLYIRLRSGSPAGPAEARILLRDRYDPTTDFSAMERTTGWHAAMVCALQASGTVKPGAHRVETGVPAGLIFEGAVRRGFALRYEVIQ